MFLLSRYYRMWQKKEEEPIILSPPIDLGPRSSISLTRSSISLTRASISPTRPGEIPKPEIHANSNINNNNSASTAANKNNRRRKSATLPAGADKLRNPNVLQTIQDIMNDSLQDVKDSFQDFQDKVDKKYVANTVIEVAVVVITQDHSLLINYSYISLGSPIQSKLNEYKKAMLNNVKTVKKRTEKEWITNVVDKLPKHHSYTSVSLIYIYRCK